MGYPTNPPPFPVVDREPSLRKTLASFRSGDWSNVALAVGASVPLGYYAGRPVLMMQSMWMAAGLGAAGGMCIGLQASFGRLTGYLPNGEEVARTKVTAQPQADLTS